MTLEELARETLHGLRLRKQYEEHKTLELLTRLCEWEQRLEDICEQILAPATVKA